VCIYIKIYMYIDIYIYIKGVRARSLIYTVKFGRQFGFKSAAATDLSLILLRFLFICARSKRMVSGSRRNVIGWWHLHHRSKLSAVNDSFSHIAFSLTTHTQYIYIITCIIQLYILYIYTALRWNCTLKRRRHLLRIVAFISVVI